MKPPTPQTFDLQPSTFDQDLFVWIIFKKSRRFNLNPIRAIRIIRVIRDKNSPLTMIHSPFAIFFVLSSFLSPLCPFAQHPRGAPCKGERVVSFVLKGIIRVLRVHLCFPRPCLPLHLNRVSNALFYEGKLFEPRFECLFYERKPFEPPFEPRTPRGKGKSVLLGIQIGPPSSFLLLFSFVTLVSFVFKRIELLFNRRRSKIVNRKSPPASLTSGSIPCLPGQGSPPVSGTHPPPVDPVRVQPGSPPPVCARWNTWTVCPVAPIVQWCGGRAGS